MVATGVVPVDVSQVIQTHVVVQVILPIHLLVGVITAVVQGVARNVIVIGGIVAWTLLPRRRRIVQMIVGKQVAGLLNLTGVLWEQVVTRVG